MAKQRVQTQYQQGQVRLNPQASVVDTFVRPSRNDQLSKALDSVTGNVARVQQEEERELDMIQAGKKQAAHASYNVGYKSLMEQERFSRLSAEEKAEDSEYKELVNSTLSQVTDETLRGVLSNSITQSMVATSDAASAGWERKDLLEAGADLASGTVDLWVDESTAQYELNPDATASVSPDGLTQEQLQEEMVLGLPSKIADIERILKEKYGYSNTDLQEFWLLEQERRGEVFHDTLIGDYLLSAGHGGPEFRNKTIALIERAKAHALVKSTIATTDDLMRWQGQAGAGTFKADSDLQARKAMKEERITTHQYRALHTANLTAINNQAASARLKGATATGVAMLLAGEGIVGETTYVDANGVTKTVSKSDIERAAQLRISEMVKEQVPDGDPDKSLAVEIGLYTRANLINNKWAAQVGKAFDNLGSGDMGPESPQWKATMSKFKLMKHLHAGNPQMFKKYLTNPTHRIMFTDWRVMSAYDNSETDALRQLGSADHLPSKASNKDLQGFADAIVSNLDKWTKWDDVAGDDEHVKTLFKEKMVEYAKVVAKYSGLNPKEIVDEYMDEVVADHSVVNGKLVFMGNFDLDNNQFQKDAQLHLEKIKASIAYNAADVGQLTLRHTGRGDTFWIVDQAGRVLPTAPLSLSSFNGAYAKQERHKKRTQANEQLNNKSNNVSARSGAR